MERLHQYLCGRKFLVRTDHRCLKEVLTGNVDQNKAPARVIRWSYRLLPYSFSVEYIQGRTNVVADALSRLSNTVDDLQKNFEISSVDFIP